VNRLSQKAELRPAREHAPGALAALESAYDAAAVAIDPRLADCLRLRVAEDLGLEAPEDSAPPASERERACVEFTDQFVTYVPGVTEAQREAVGAELGRDLRLELARMIYVFDMTDRLILSLGRLFEPRAAEDEALAPVAPKPLGDAVDDLHASAMLLHALDPVTTELVRLHCARYHDCKT
jgi:alkylhydroperoxidase family enzyme